MADKSIEFSIILEFKVPMPLCAPVMFWVLTPTPSGFSA